MEFSRITEQEYTRFAETCPSYNYMQTIANARRRSFRGLVPHLVGIKLEGTLVACAILTESKNTSLFSKFECVLGPIVDYNDVPLVTFFLAEIISYVKANKGIFLLINPNIISIERDINANVIKNGVNNLNIRELLIGLGFKWLDKIESNPFYTNWQFVKDLKSINSEETLLNSFDKKTQYCINKAFSYGVKVSKMNRDEIHKFKKIVDKTASEKGFSTFSLQYYLDFEKVSQENTYSFFLKAEIEPVVTLRIIDKEINIQQIECLKITESVENEKFSKKQLNRIKSINEIIDGLQRKRILIQDKKDKFVIASSLFLVTNHEIIYFTSGSDSEYNSFFAPYLIQFEAMKYAISNRITRYNFYGTGGVFNNKPDQTGVYEFKKGFGGVVEEKIGYYEYIINPVVYYLSKFIRKIIVNK